MIKHICKGILGYWIKMQINIRKWRCLFWISFYNYFLVGPSRCKCCNSIYKWFQKWKTAILWKFINRIEKSMLWYLLLKPLEQLFWNLPGKHRESVFHCCVTKKSDSSKISNLNELKVYHCLPLFNRW